MAPGDTRVIVCFGDSITDGTASTMNGEDRWPNVLSRRCRPRAIAPPSSTRASAAIRWPDHRTTRRRSRFRAGHRPARGIERDVLSLSGVSAVIWLEGINDFSRNGNASVDIVTGRMREIVSRMRARQPGIKVFGATVATALGATNQTTALPSRTTSAGSSTSSSARPASFDGIVDFDAATLDPATGGLKAEFVPDSTTGGPGDKLHPNRAGYLAMGNSIDLDMVVAKPSPW